jgi:hypothetical protein
MRLFETINAAKDLNVDLLYAVSRRLSYLTSQDFDLSVAIAELEEDAECKSPLPLFAIGALQARERLREEQAVLHNWLESLRKTATISEDDILAAREVPVETLVEFVRGKATAWCHDDRNPSAFHGTNNNLVVCPVCDKKFGPIDILIHRDGMSFIDAVKCLNGR